MWITDDREKINEILRASESRQEEPLSTLFLDPNKLYRLQVLSAVEDTPDGIGKMVRVKNTVDGREYVLILQKSLRMRWSEVNPRPGEVIGLLDKGSHPQLGHDYTVFGWKTEMDVERSKLI